MPRDDWARATAKMVGKRESQRKLLEGFIGRDPVMCPACGSLNNKITYQTFKNGTRHKRCECSDCKKFIQYLSQ